MPGSCQSLVAGADMLAKQPQPSTPKRATGPAPYQNYIICCRIGWFLFSIMSAVPFKTSRCDLKNLHILHFSMRNSKVKSESPDAGCVFSPETAALIKGLSDSPESLQLKAEILRSANQLNRGPILIWSDPFGYVSKWSVRFWVHHCYFKRKKGHFILRHPHF